MTQSFQKRPLTRACSWISTVGCAGIGLAQHAKIFPPDDIDDELLRRLPNDDLKEVGVASFGHGKKLLEVIAEVEHFTQRRQFLRSKQNSLEVKQLER